MLSWAVLEDTVAHKVLHSQLRLHSVLHVIFRIYGKRKTK